MNAELEQPDPSPGYEFSTALILLKKMVETGEIKTASPFKFGGLIHVLHESLNHNPNLTCDEIKDAQSFLTKLKQELEKQPDSQLNYKLEQIDRILERLETLLKTRQSTKNTFVA